MQTKYAKTIRQHWVNYCETNSDSWLNLICVGHKFDNVASHVSEAIQWVWG